MVARTAAARSRGSRGRRRGPARVWRARAAHVPRLRALAARHARRRGGRGAVGLLARYAGRAARANRPAHRPSAARRADVPGPLDQRGDPRGPRHRPATAGEGARGHALRADAGRLPRVAAPLDARARSPHRHAHHRTQPARVRRHRRVFRRARRDARARGTRCHLRRVPRGGQPEQPRRAGPCGLSVPAARRAPARGPRPQPLADLRHHLQFPEPPIGRRARRRGPARDDRDAAGRRQVRPHAHRDRRRGRDAGGPRLQHRPVQRGHRRRARTRARAAARGRAPRAGSAHRHDPPCRDCRGATGVAGTAD